MALKLVFNPFTGNFDYINAGSGSSVQTVAITAGENLAANDALYISAGATDGGRTAGRAYKIDPTDDKRIDFIGFTSAAITSGASGTAQVVGGLSGFTGLTPGAPIFASVTVPGSYQVTAPNISGQWLIQLGVPVTASILAINGAGSSTAIKIQTAGSVVYPGFLTVVTASATLTGATQFVNVNFAGTCNITLPVAVAGQSCNIKSLTANNVVITPASGTIDGSATLTISGINNSFYLVSDGTNWFLN